MVCMQFRQVWTALLQLGQCSFDAGDLEGKIWVLKDIEVGRDFAFNSLYVYREVSVPTVSTVLQRYTFPEIIYSSGGANPVFCRAGRTAQLDRSHFRGSTPACDGCFPRSLLRDT